MSFFRLLPCLILSSFTRSFAQEPVPSLEKAASSPAATRRRGALTGPLTVSSGTQTLTETNLHGEVELEEVVDIASGQIMDWKKANAVDPYTGKPTEVEYRSGEKEYRTYACCGLVSQTSKEGVVTEYLRDPNDVVKRVYCTKTTYPDGGGTVKDTVKFDGLTTTTTRKLDTVSFLASESVRHLNGELLSTKSPDANGDGTPETTTYLPVTLVTLPGNVTLGEIRTTKHPDHSDEVPSTTVTESYRDGRTKSITGEAVANVAYNYGVNTALSYGSNPGFKATVTRTTRLTATGGISEWTEESRDPLGRSVQTAWSGTTPVATRTYFSTTAAAGSRGRLASATDADGVTVTYTYNPRGEPATTTTPHPGPLGTGGTRVETVARDVIPTITPLPGQTLAPAVRTVRSIGGTVVDTTYQSGDGLKSARVAFGRTSVSMRTVPTTAGAWSTTTIHPDGTRTHTAVTKAGLEQTTSFRNTAAADISSTTAVRNALGRLLSTTDSRTGTTTYTDHTPAGQALTTTLPGTPARITTVKLDKMGRTVEVDAPDTAIAGGPSTNVTFSSYYPTGQLKAQWGAQTSPVFYAYDEQGRMVNLRTYRALALNTEPTAASGDLTTWIYDPARGWLTGKLDAASQGATYTYTGAGRLRTRKWARGNWTRYDYASGVQTHTRYFTAATSETTMLAASAGNDDDTPDTAYSFDPLGRLASAKTFLGSAPATILTSNEFQYTNNFTVDREIITVDPDGSGSIPALTRILERNEDSLQRSEGWKLRKLLTPEPNPTYDEEHANAYSYTPASGPVDGRLVSVTGSSSIFKYGYETNSAHLVATVTGPTLTGGVFKVTNTWFPDRDALNVKENSVGTGLISKYNYSVNELSQRSNVETSGDAFGSAKDATNWGYDDLGQVVSADHPNPANTFGYAYDRMGNRKQSSRNTTNPSSASGADLATYRPDSGSSEGGNSLNQYGVLELYGATTSLANTYDLDGNQKEGRFPTTPDTTTSAGNVRTWDGENRLIIATVHGGTPTLYTYDAFHRRVAKRTSSSHVSLTLYDGWNPIADYIRQSSSQYVVIESFTWGKDLSGSFQGAGGVGGLLAVERSGYHAVPGIYYPTYDGNGNVSEYLDAAGDVAAHYEYGPFGEESYVFEQVTFRHRFSTKPLDWETGYYYYGYRYYDPLTGRWPSRDPIGERGGFNLYTSFKNSLGNLDVLGLCNAQLVGKKRNCKASNWEMRSPASEQESKILSEKVRKAAEDAGKISDIQALLNIGVGGAGIACSLKQGVTKAAEELGDAIGDTAAAITDKVAPSPGDVADTAASGAKDIGSYYGDLADLNQVLRHAIRPNEKTTRPAYAYLKLSYEVCVCCDGKYKWNPVTEDLGPISRSVYDGPGDNAKLIGAEPFKNIFDASEAEKNDAFRQAEARCNM